MSLDSEIAEARAQRAKLQAMADAGDKITQIVVRRLNDAERATLDAWAAGFLERPFGSTTGNALKGLLPND